MKPTTDHPVISVVMPTYRRPELMTRAIESVLAQRFGDFELIVSDDEDPPGESRLIAERQAARDPRVRVIANAGGRGQASNLNFAMRHARGRWIKPLYDDDAMEPECLERMLAAAMMAPGAVSVVRCLAKRFEHGRARPVERRGRRGVVEWLSSRDAILAQYLQDVDVGIPSQMMVWRGAVEAGAEMPTGAGLVSNVDSAWSLELLGHGSLVLLNEALVHQHQGGHETVTSGIAEVSLDAEFALLREMQFERLGASTGVPCVETAQSMLRAIRALQRARRWRLWRAATLACSVRSLRGWRLAGRWALRRAMPGRFELVTRTRLSTEPRHDDARRDPGVRLQEQQPVAHDGVSDARDRRAVG